MSSNGHKNGVKRERSHVDNLRRAKNLIDHHSKAKLAVILAMIESKPTFSRLVKMSLDSMPEIQNGDLNDLIEIEQENDNG